MKGQAAQLHLQMLLQDFYRITQIGISYLPKEAPTEAAGATYFSAQDAAAERLIAQLQRIPELMAQMETAEAEALAKAMTKKEGMISCEIFPGLMKYVSPVLSRGILLGCFVLGPVRREGERALYERSQHAKLLQAHHMDAQQLSEMYAQIPRVDQAAILAGSRLLTQIAVYASSVESITLHSLPLAPRIVEYISTQYMTPISPSTAAEHFHISRSTLSRTLSREYGETFLSLLNQCRIRNVCRLLDAGLSPEEASNQTGFSTPQYMARVFRSIMGCTPHMYRQSREKPRA